VNVTGFNALSVMTLEVILIITLVLVSGAHGLIAAIYFFIDDGIKAKQVRAESVAYHERRIDDINRAKEILALAEQGAKDEDAIAAKYGGMEVLNEILGQLRGDTLATTIHQSEPAAKPITSSPAIKPIAPQSLTGTLPDPVVVKGNGHGSTDPL
jgi:hypothetical protein